MRPVPVPSRALAVLAVLASAIGVVGSVPSGAAPTPPPPSHCAAATSDTPPPDAALPEPIPDQASVSSTVFAAASAGYVYDVDVTVDIDHAASGDLDVRLTSPKGQQVVLTTNNGGGTGNVFAGTRFDDDADPGTVVPYATPSAASMLVTDTAFATGVVETSLAPEGSLAAFDGQPAAGAWTLTVKDDAAGNVGTLQGWTLHLTTVASRPQQLEAPPVSLVSVGSTISESASSPQQLVVPAQPGPVADVVLDLDVRGDDSAIDATLTSPGGTSITLSTDNGTIGTSRLGGVRFSDAGTTPVTDVNFDGPLGTVQPEEAFAAFAGEVPTGTWTLDIMDDVPGGATTFHGASLIVRTQSCPRAPVAPPAPPRCGTAQSLTVDSLDVPIAVTDGGTIVSTLEVPGTNRLLHDVDVVLDLAHARADDLDVRLESPQGTTIDLTSDNLGAVPDQFRVVRFDDDADPDGSLPHAGNDGVVTDGLPRPWGPTPRLTPEAALASLRKENPAGTWTLTVVDDSAGVGGTLHSWGLRATTMPRIGPGPTSVVGSSEPVVVPDGGRVDVPIVVSGATSPVSSVQLTTDLRHPTPGDLDVTLRSPGASGPFVTLTTDNGGSAADLFDGTLWHDGAPLGATDAAGPASIPDLAPEEPFGAFVGDAPAGTWLLSIVDDTPGGGAGSLDGYELEVSTDRCNQTPTGTSEEYVVAETAGLTTTAATGVLDNDADADGDPIVAVLQVGPTHGAVDLHPDGSFTYTPTTRYLGPDSFTYRVSDGSATTGDLTASLIVEPPTCLPPGPFSDVPDSHAFCGAIVWMANDGITQGYADGSFKPTGAVTRQAMAAFLYRLDHPEGGAPPACEAKPLPDVPADSPFCGAIAWMVGEGITGGYADGTFRPTAAITRQAMASFLFKLEFGGGAPVPPCVLPAPFADVPVAHPFCGQIDWMAGEGIAGGYADGTFKPSAVITRQAMAAFLQRFVHRPA